VYLGKPTAGKKEEKPLLIPDFVDMYLGSTEPEEQEIGSSGGAQVIVRAFKKKTPALETITLSQWMGTSVKILNVLLKRQNMDVTAIQDYLAYIAKVLELIEEHTWQSVILYDNEYRKLQHRHGFRWGSDSQHLHTRFLKKRQGTFPSNHTPPAGVRASKSSTELLFASSTTHQPGVSGHAASFSTSALHQGVARSTLNMLTIMARKPQLLYKMDEYNKLRQLFTPFL